MTAPKKKPAGAFKNPLADKDAALQAARGEAVELESAGKQEDRARLNARVSADDYRWLKIQAATDGVTLDQLVQEAVTDLRRKYTAGLGAAQKKTA